jgi:hypothetical protein
MADIGIYDMTDTWNAGGTTFTAIKMNVTDTASAAASLVMDLQVGGTSRLKLAKGGNLTVLGVYSATVGGTNRDVYVDNTGLIGYVSSTRASKTQIAPLANVDWLLELAPSAFRYRAKNEAGAYTDQTDGPIQYGLIAEDVEEVNPELCYYDLSDDEPQLVGVNYSKLITPLLALVQQQQDQIAALEARLTALEDS